MSALVVDYLAHKERRVRPRTFVEISRYLTGDYFKALHNRPIDCLEAARGGARLTVPCLPSRATYVSRVATKHTRVAMKHVPADTHDSQVLSFRQWCMLNNISPRTGHRILKSPGGPIITRLSERRFGITVGNNRRWQASRERAS